MTYNDPTAADRVTAAQSPSVTPLADGWGIWPQVAVRSAGLPAEMVAQFAVPGLDADTAVPAEQVREVTKAAVRSALVDNRFLVALCWQNPAVVTTWAARLAADAREGRPILASRRNERERVVSRYVQRYCMKNESIGFFGPVAWARFTDEAEELRYAGDLGLRSLSVSLETWAVAALADAWRRDPEVFAQLPIRLNPAVSAADGQVIRPRHSAADLPGLDRELVAMLSPGATCGALVNQVANATGADKKTLASRLMELSRTGVLQIGFSVPFCEHPEQHLRRQLDGLPCGEVRSGLLGCLDRVTSAAGGAARRRAEAG
ncbi:MAG: lantibiotic dehydratase [Streptosporangiaceae bacterium]